MEKKQTAIEWLMTELSMGLKITIANKLQKAKAMEKEQIIDAYNSGQQIPPFEYAEKFYEQTYGK